jgi:hypothetical protein
MIPFQCAWQHCLQNFRGDMPEGWIWLLTFWATRPVGIIDPLTQPLKRDGVLCPEHARALEAQLKYIG